MSIPACPGTGEPWRLERRRGVNPMCPVCYVRFPDEPYGTPETRDARVPEHPAGLSRADGPWPRPTRR